MTTVSPIPPGYHSLTVYLMLRDINGFLAFMKQAFDAQVVRQIDTPEGKAGHAELRLGDSHLMVGDPMGGGDPRPGMLYFYVTNADAVYQQAIAAGAEPISPPTDMFYGDRNACVRDRWGNTWWIATHIEDVNEGELQRRAAESFARRSKTNP